MSALASLGMGSLNHSAVQDLCDANMAVERLKAEHFLELPHIPIHQVRWATVQDASWANAVEDHSQGAFLVGATSPGLWNNLPSPLCFVESQVSLFETKVFKYVSCGNSDHVRRLGRGRVDSWSLRRADLSPFQHRRMGNHVSEPRFHSGCTFTRRSKRLPKVLSIGDAKSLCDHLRTETSGVANDRRTAMDIQIIGSRMEAQGATVRWVDHRPIPISVLSSGQPDLETVVSWYSSDAEVRFPKVLSIGDVKSLCDNLRTETLGGANDRRTAIDFIIASMDVQGATVRFVDPQWHACWCNDEEKRLMSHCFRAHATRAHPHH